MRYLGQIHGSATAVGGNPPWANVTVILGNVNSGAGPLAQASEPVFVYAAGGTILASE